MQTSLVKYQKKAYKEEVARYTFTAKGGGAESEISDEKKAIRKGITLHFFRYGFIPKKSELDSVINMEGINGRIKFTPDDIKVSNSDIPEIDNFYLARTFLNSGYLYLIDKKENGKYKEWEIDELGRLKPIVWTDDNNGDIRTSSGQTITSITVNNGDEYYVAYSPVQWSKKYFNEINASDEKKEKLMQVISCVGIEKSTSNTDDEVVAYDKVNVAYYRGNEQWRVLRNTLKNIAADEKNQDKKGGNDIFEDMFITLNDPIGIAEDIALQLITEHNKHKALIESIQFGENEDNIFARLERNESRSESFSYYEQQVSSLFSTTLTTYQLIYNNGKMEEEYADTTDKNKLLKILAVKERKAIRNKIIKIRNDFGTILSSNYYQNYVPIYTEGGNQNVFEGNHTILSHLEILAIHPHDRDRHLDLKKDYTGKQDKWKNFFLSTLNGNNNITELLNKKIKLEDLKVTPLNIKTQFKLERKLIKTLKSISGAYAKYAVRDTDFQVVLKYIKSFKYRGETLVIQVRRNQLESAVKKGFTLNIGKWVEEQQLVDYKPGHKLIRIKAGANDVVTKEIITNKRIEVPVTGTGNKASRWITKTLAHPKFRAFIAGLELINTAVKINKLNTTANFKNKLSVGGAISSLNSAATSYVEAKMVAKGFEKELTSLVGKGAKIFGFVGSGVTVTMCVWDSIEAYQARDYDTSLTWAITGALSAVLLADGIVAFATGATVGFLTFWPLAILFVLVLVGVALAIYFTDSPLEKFLKNSVLSSEHPLIAGNEAPYVYIKKVYDKRTTLVESDFKEWRDLKKASQLLYDLLISYRVKEDVIQFYYENKPNKSWKDHLIDAIELNAGIKYEKVKEITLKVYLRKFLYNKSSFDFAMKLYVKGIKESSDNGIMLLAQKTSITTDDNGADVLNVTYNLPQTTIDKITLASEFIFISRTIINKELNEYWPHKNGDEERYMAYKFPATDWLAPTGDMIIANRVNEVLDEVWGTNIKIGTEKEIYNPKIWKR